MVNKPTVRAINKLKLGQELAVSRSELELVYYRPSLPTDPALENIIASAYEFSYRTNYCNGRAIFSRLTDGSIGFAGLIVRRDDQSP